MAALREMPPGELHVKRLWNGRRELLRDYCFELDGEPVLIPEGFDTNYSSWKGFLPGPDYSVIDLAGLSHDFVWRYGYFGYLLTARKVGFREGNKIWYQIARSGNDETRCGAIWAGMGRVGLTAGGWISYLRYRKSREKYAEELRARKAQGRA